MFSVEWDQEDLNSLVISLDGLDPQELVGDELLPFTKNLVDFTAEYPPPKPDSKYVRTGHLGDSWFYHQMNPLMTMVNNMAAYAGYVQGREQVAMHKETGWTNLYEEAEKRVRGFIERLKYKAGKIWSS